MPISAVTFATTILPVHPTTKGEGRGGGALGLNKDQSRGTEDALCSATGRNGRSPYQEPPGSSPIGSTSAGGGETVCLCRRILVSQERINIASITFSIVSVRRSSFLAGKLCKILLTPTSQAPSPAEDISTPPDKTRPSIPLPPPLPIHPSSLPPSMQNTPAATQPLR
ncbi:hypothetical protein ABZX51_009190 [Aspergillus tubingensis]